MQAQYVCALAASMNNMIPSSQETHTLVGIQSSCHNIINNQYFERPDMN